VRRFSVVVGDLPTAQGVEFGPGGPVAVQSVETVALAAGQYPTIYPVVQHVEHCYPGSRLRWLDPEE
jgi:hypothetical protein